MKPRLRILLALSCFFAFTFGTQIIAAQSDPTTVTRVNETGTRPYESFGGARENINLATGNLNIVIPLLKLPGRNGHDVEIVVAYDSKIWQVRSRFNPAIGDYTLWWEKEKPAGWGDYIPRLYAQYGDVVGWPNVRCYQSFVIRMPDGTKYSFPDARGNCMAKVGTSWVPSPANNQSSYARDGQLFYLDISTIDSTMILRLKNGSRIYFGNAAGSNLPAQKSLDSNGNVITFNADNTWTDSLGRIVGVSPFSITYHDSSGATQTITINYTGHTISPVFNNPTSYVCANPCTMGGISSIVFPNGRSFTFEYNDPQFGRLTKITYPTGGYTKYSYQVFMMSNNLDIVDSPEVVTKRVCTNPSGTCTPSEEQITTYTPTIVSTNDYNSQNTVVDPLGNQTVVVFAATGYTHRETQRSIYTGNGTSATLLRTINTTYGTPSNCSLDAFFPIQQTTTLDDGKVIKVEWDYDTYGTCSTGNPITVREYDFGGTTLLRKTVSTWLKVNPVNSQDYFSSAIYVRNRKASEQVQDGVGNIIAQTQYEYDNFAANGNISPSGAVQHDSSFGTSYVTRGNVTAIKRWRNTDGAWLSTNNQFDDAGNILRTTDPLGHATQFSYADNFTDGTSHNAQAYITQITYPVTGTVNHIERRQYFFAPGLLAASCGQNFPSASPCANTYSPPQPDYARFSYDSMNRLILATAGDGGQTSHTFNEASLPLSVTSSTLITTGTTVTSTVTVDGVGRVTRTSLDSDPDGITYVDITYDAAGQKKTVSNPYRTTGDPTYGLTTYQLYDGLGRIRAVVYPDGGTVQTDYCGSATKVTDQAGKWRRIVSDALGRLAEVDEPNSGTASAGACPQGGDPVAVTNYSYNLINKVLTITQSGSRQRTMIWNSLGQLLAANNPETGAVNYAYDNDGNITSKSDPRGTSITYHYDALHRVDWKDFSDTTQNPDISYFYDQTSYNGLTIANGIGRRTGTSDPAGAEAWTFDVIGRALTDHRTTNGITKDVSYTYNLDGSVATLTYPSGRTITYTPTAAGRTLSAVDTVNAINYATAAHYAPDGQLCSLVEGSSFTETYTLNNRLQPNRLHVTTTGAPASPCGSPSQAATLLDFTYGFNLGVGNNGNIVSIANNRDHARDETFTYDELNRLATAVTPTGNPNTWSQTFSYDVWGNLNTITSAGAPALCVNVGTNNRLTTTCGGGTTFSYDGVGNMTSDGSYNYAYNAESQIKTAAGIAYTYDGDGRRVQKSNGKLYWYGMSSEPLAESDLSGNLSDEYIFFGARRVARRNVSTSIVFYYFADQLGSSRVIVQAGQTTACYEADNYPFGGERTPVVNTCPQNYKFDGKERDVETGADYFGARYFTSQFGRWFSADWSATPEAVPYASFSNPQSLNLYAFVMNSPITHSDLDGHAEMHGGGELFGGFGPNAGNLYGEAFQQQDAEFFESISVNYLLIPNSTGGSPQQPREGAPAQNQNQPALVPLPQGLKYTVATPGPNSPDVHLLFAPEVAQRLADAIQDLNKQGIVPQINSGFRTNEEQAYMRAGGSGPNPAARVSWHQAGGAVDINGTRSPQFKRIIAAMEKHGFVWGGNFKPKADPPHFDARKFMGNLNQAVRRAQSYWDSTQ